MIMKKVINSLFVIIAAMVTFAGCAKQEIDAPATSETKTVQFFANSIETKTEFGTPTDGVYPTLWSAEDKVKILVNLDQLKDTEKTVAVECSDDFKSARFKAELADPQTESYTFYSISPSTKLIGKPAGKLYVEIKDAQTPLATSVDKEAQLLFAKSKTTEKMPTSVDLNYQHLTAYGKFSLANLADESVLSIKIEAPEDVYLAGKWDYVIADDNLVVRTGNGLNTITLTTSSTTDIWFACAPVDMTGQKMTLTVTTEKGNFVKVLNFPADKERKFEAGKISKFTVDMAGIEVEEPEQPGETTAYYEKVTSAPTDWSGKYLLVVEDGVNKALSGISTTSTKYGLAEEVEINDAKIIASEELSAYEVVIAKASTSGAYTMAFDSSLLYWTSGNSLAVNSTESDNTRWTISLDNGKLSIYNCKDSARQLLWNKSSPRFACYTGKADNAGYYYPHLYKLVGGSSEGGGETPEPEPVDKQTIAEVIALNTDAAVNTEGLVVAKYERGILISDASGIIIVYKGEAVDAQIGDQVAVSGKKGVHNGWAQIATPTVEVTSSGNNVTYPSVAELNGSGMDDLLSATSVSYIQYTGTLTISGTYYNVGVEGATTAIGSIQYPVASLGLSDMNGKKIKVTGYHVGISSGKYVNTMATSVEVVETEEEPETPAPVINISTASPIEVAANGGNGTILYAIENPTTATITATDDADWLTLGEPTSTSVSYTVIENTGEERTATIELAYEGAESKTVTVKQAAAQSEPDQPGQGGGDEKVPSTTACYVLDGTKTGGTNGYATESEITQGDITWGVVGNTTVNPWRIGGKNISNENRPIYTKTAYSAELSKIEFVSGTVGLTWHSLTLEYSENADFTNSQEITASGIGANKTITFAPEGGFPANCYFKFKINVTNTNKNDNKYLQLSAIKFYGYKN